MEAGRGGKSRAPLCANLRLVRTMILQTHQKRKTRPSRLRQHSGSSGVGGPNPGQRPSSAAYLAASPPQGHGVRPRPILGSESVKTH